MDINEIMPLFQQGKYEDVIALSKDSKNEDVLFIKAISYSFLNQYQNAIKVLSDNEQILKNQFGRLIDTHIQICLWSNEFLDAQKALQHYEEYPYVSQEIEERFLMYKKEIEKRIKNVGKTMHSEDDLIDMLNCGDSNSVQLAINEIKKLDITPYITSLKKVLLDNPSESTRTLALVALCEKKYNEIVKFNYHGELIDVIPSQIANPFKSQLFNRLYILKDEMKDTTYAQTYESILATYFLYVFPKQVKEDELSLHTALDIVTRKYLSMPINKMRQSPDVERLILLIDKANADF